MRASPFGSMSAREARDSTCDLKVRSSVPRVRTTEPSLQGYNAPVKRYGQYCPVAHALDQIGDRWALLIVRELLLGQRRFTDLSEALPEIGSNILTARLRSLDAAGIVRKTKLPPPLGVTVYELTPDGRALE